MKAYGITDKGKVRRINQDSFLYDLQEEQDRAVAVLCDGMGGERAGEVASELAAGAFLEHALKSFTLGGESFYEWLVDEGLFDKDARGNARGASWWPGSYQK